MSMYVQPIVCMFVRAYACVCRCTHMVVAVVFVVVVVVVVYDPFHFCDLSLQNLCTMQTINGILRLAGLQCGLYNSKQTIAFIHANNYNY